MSIGSLLVLLLVAGICGAIGQRLPEFPIIWAILGSVVFVAFLSELVHVATQRANASLITRQGNQGCE
ncbi:MAG: hypothetical protein AB7U82_22200 [Blastocatellales bacterium]